MLLSFFFFNDTATTEIYTLSLHDALPILKTPMQRPSIPNFHVRSVASAIVMATVAPATKTRARGCSEESITRSEEHTSELQSPCNLVCRLLLEKKKTDKSISLTDSLHSSN